MDAVHAVMLLVVDPEPAAVHYLPIGTTILAAVFCGVIVLRYFSRRTGPHLLWWAAGIFFYGLGTALESAITLQGNSILLNKLWYVAGALLGGYPLAQGTVYLLLSRRVAHVLTALTVPFIIVLSVLVMRSPVNMDALEPHRPGGAILGWTWIRAMTPIINGYAALFLIGGAILSAVRYARLSRLHFGKCPQCEYSLVGLTILKGGVNCPECGANIRADEIGLQSASDAIADDDFTAARTRHELRRLSAGYRAVGNTLIAIGAIFPGVGGGLAKAGMVEALYVGEFVGLLLIWAGYAACVRRPRAAGAPANVAHAAN